MMNYDKSFDQLLDEILTDYRNQFPEADTSKGSLIFIKSAASSAAHWGIYQYQKWIARQIFADTADEEYLEHHAWIHDLTRVSGESNAELLTRYLDHIRRPPAGGNKYDHIKWAKEIDNVAEAWCIPLGQGLGTVDVIIMADEGVTGSEIPSSHTMTGSATSVSSGKLVDAAADFTVTTDGGPVRIGDIAVNDDTGSEAVVTAVDGATQLSLESDIFKYAGHTYTLKSLTAQVHDYIDDVRPVTGYGVRVLPPDLVAQDVSMTITGTANKSAIAAAITAFMDGLVPGEILYLTQLAAIAIQYGAENAIVSEPSADVTPGVYEMIRPGTVSIS
jgi:uncharacterized phage protein gp47/JayE